MTLIPIIISFIFIGIFFTGIIIAIRRAKQNRELLCSVSSPKRGTSSERRLVVKLLRLGIHPDTIFHDIYVQISPNRFSQIDIAIPTKVGIIVFEVKDYSGWIFGNGRDKYWTQILNYGKEKHRFYNPILQNNGHIEALKRAFETNPNIPYFSVIVFDGNSIIKKTSNIPENTFIIYPSHIASTIEYILTNNPPAQYGNKRDILTQLNQAKNNGNNEHIINQHIFNAQMIKKPESIYKNNIKLFSFPKFRLPRRWRYH